MKIVFFSRLFYPHIGGVEKHILKISQILLKQGFQIQVITENYNSELKNYETIHGINIYRIPYYPNNFYKKFVIWIWLWKNRKIWVHNDILHFHDVFYWYFPFRFMYPKKNVFTTFHGYESYPIPFKNIIIRKISELLSHKTMCIGDFMKKWYNAYPSVVAYGGIDTIKAGKKPYHKKSALFVGRLDEQTGILFYYELYKALKKKHKDFLFTVVGEGKFEKKITGVVVKNGVDDPSSFYTSHRFAFVSRYLSILEALYAKKLVFATYDNPVKKDYLEMAPFAPFIIIENDLAKMKQKIEYFLQNEKEEKKYVEQGYQWVKNMTWENMANNYVSLWGVKLH